MVCFILGIITPTIAHLIKKDNTVILSLDHEKYETEFLKTPSVALIDSIETNTLSCICDNHDYDYFIYYWILKDSSFNSPISHDSFSFHHTIMSFFTDSTRYYSPNSEMMDLSRSINNLIQCQVSK